MTDPTSLIAEARNRVAGAARVREYIPADLITRLADALEEEADK